jgi:hypothetical protein
MRLTGLRTLLFLLVVVFLAGAGAGCDNPLDPLKASDKIQGLTYFDFSATQAHWDSDPEWDGLQISLSYFNEFSGALNFHDKPHKITIDFYSELTVEGSSTPVRGNFLTSKTVEFSNSDDLINIPIEFYGGFLALPSATSITGCLLLHVFPPQESPQKELISFQCGIELFAPEAALVVPI